MTKETLEKLQLLLTIIGLTAPLGYLIGVGYHHGFLAAYHISPDAFPISVQDTYLNAYIFIELLFIDAKNIVESIFISLRENLLGSLVYLVVLFLVIFTLMKLPTIKKWLIAIKVIKGLREIITFEKVKESDTASATFLTMLISYIIVLVLAVLGGLYVLWAVVFFVPYKIAEDSSIETRDTFIEKGCFYENKTFSNCKSLEKDDGTEIIKGLLVIQNKTHVAFFTKEGSSIMPIPKSSRIKSEFKKLKPKSKSD